MLDASMFVAMSYTSPSRVNHSNQSNHSKRSNQSDPTPQKKAQKSAAAPSYSDSNEPNISKDLHDSNVSRGIIYKIYKI